MDNENATHSLTFVKLGGSVITHKDQHETPDTPVISRLAGELHSAMQQHPGMRLLVGHGSGSFGHSYAARYGVHTGMGEQSDWMGFALTAGAALRLNRIVVDALLAAGVPALSLQPSASLRCRSSTIEHWQTDVLVQALARHMVPVIHGDVAFDADQGSTIVSTEVLFEHLARLPQLQPSRIILIGETAVYTADPFTTPQAERIPLITRANRADVLDMAGGSRAVDVTGGMQSKLRLMWQLVEALPALEIYLITPQPGALLDVLLNPQHAVGTRMRLE